MVVLKKTLIATLLLSLLTAGGLAIPTGEFKDGMTTRANDKTGDKTDPLPLNLDISEWADIGEENCYSMLCRFNGNRVWQRAVAASANGRHRQANGADKQPCKAENLAERHTEQINSATTSAEEFPWASMELGGETAGLMPATPNEQGPQGREFSRQYEAQKVDRNKWFRLTFHNSKGPLGTYCTALFKDPPDTSICDKDPEQTLFGSAGVRLSGLIFIYNKAHLPFSYHKFHREGKTRRSVEVAVV